MVTMTTLTGIGRAVAKQEHAAVHTTQIRTNLTREFIERDGKWPHSGGMTNHSLDHATIAAMPTVFRERGFKFFF
jgi:hypothetical protein